MKICAVLFWTLLLCIVFGNPASAQSQQSITHHFIKGDSINMAFDVDYNLIADNCAKIIRYVHFDEKNGFYKGNFTDVSRQKPEVILAEGTYNEDGLKNGPFTTRYINGNLQAKGSFKNNQYNGKWQLYYPDGKPKVTFEAKGKALKVLEAWNEKGSKTTENGRGNYQCVSEGMLWKGKLANGTPDGTWKLIQIDNGTNKVLMEERFKNRVFKKGVTPTESYADSSRIVLIAPDALPFVHAEMLNISAVSCSNVPQGNFSDAYAGAGKAEFERLLMKGMAKFIKPTTPNPKTSTVVVNAIVDEKGAFTKAKGDDKSDIDYALAIRNILQQMPPLSPAILNGRPVKQKFSLTFIFDDTVNGYRFEYHFLPPDNSL